MSATTPHPATLQYKSDVEKRSKELIARLSNEQQGILIGLVYKNNLTFLAEDDLTVIARELPHVWFELHIMLGEIQKFAHLVFDYPPLEGDMPVYCGGMNVRDDFTRASINLMRTFRKVVYVNPGDPVVGNPTHQLGTKKLNHVDVAMYVQDSFIQHGNFLEIVETIKKTGIAILPDSDIRNLGERFGIITQTRGFAIQIIFVLVAFYLGGMAKPEDEAHVTELVRVYQKDFNPSAARTRSYVESGPFV